MFAVSVEIVISNESGIILPFSCELICSYNCLLSLGVNSPVIEIALAALLDAIFILYIEKTATVISNKIKHNKTVTVKKMTKSVEFITAFLFFSCFEIFFILIPPYAVCTAIVSLRLSLS